MALGSLPLPSGEDRALPPSLQSSPQVRRHLRASPSYRLLPAQTRPSAEPGGGLAPPLILFMEKLLSWGHSGLPQPLPCTLLSQPSALYYLLAKMPLVTRLCIQVVEAFLFVLELFCFLLVLGTEPRM